MSVQPPVPGSFVGKLVLLVVAIGPPALAGVGLWPDVRAHPVLAAGALVLWTLIVTAGRFLLAVGGEISKLWAPRAAAAIDRLVMSQSSYQGRYRKGLMASLRYVDLAGLPTQGEFTMRLQDVYVDVSLAPRPVSDIASEPFLGPQKATPDGQFVAKFSPKRGERASLERFLAVGDPVVLAVVAGPGTGKTTLMCRTAMSRCARGHALPMLLFLREHARAIVENGKITLPAVIAGQPWLHEAIPPAWFDRRLRKGKCVVLLDGLDEVAVEDDRKRVVDWVRAQIARYPANDFVITSRPAGYEANPLRGASVLHVRPFTAEQISRFVHGWYLATEQRATGDRGRQTVERARTAANDLLTRVKGQVTLYDFAANPLLLTMIVNVHRYRGALPGTRAELYDEMCQVLLYRRRDAKMLSDGTQLKGTQQERILRQVALHMMRHRRHDLPAQDLRRVMDPVLATLPQQVKADGLIAEMVVNGLMVERENQTFAFAHLTLQEFLAAAEIAASDMVAPGKGGAVGVLAKSVDDPWWRETTLLWAARSDASPVVAACLSSGSVAALALAFDCQEEAAGLSAELRQALDDLLTRPTDTAVRRMVDEVVVMRRLRHVVIIGNGVEMCAAPVPRDLYARFRPDEVSNGETLSGVWDVDLQPFLTWLGELSGTAYRLPTHQELQDEAVHVIAGKEAGSAWTQGIDALDLPEPVSLGGERPFAAPVSRLREVWSDDLVVAALVLVNARDTWPAPEGVVHLDEFLENIYDRPEACVGSFVPGHLPKRSLGDGESDEFQKAVCHLLHLRDLSGRQSLSEDFFAATREYVARMEPAAVKVLMTSLAVIVHRARRVAKSISWRTKIPVDEAVWPLLMDPLTQARCVPPGRTAEQARFGASQMRKLGRSGPARWGRALVLAEGILALLEPVIARATPLSPVLASCLRLGATAVALDCAEAVSQGEVELPAVREAFLDVAFGVSALQEDTGRHQDVILLVRG